DMSGVSVLILERLLKQYKKGDEDTTQALKKILIGEVKKPAPQKVVEQEQEFQEYIAHLEQGVEKAKAENYKDVPFMVTFGVGIYIDLFEEGDEAATRAWNKTRNEPGYWIRYEQLKSLDEDRYWPLVLELEFLLKLYERGDEDVAQVLKKSFDEMKKL
ncbi:MAG: hypothetical protein IKO35_02085, partial [Elusimicrobiaceae bacterium]|nr:hypothetical protein [Elusimicrobiaceae bacterium]